MMLKACAFTMLATILYGMIKPMHQTIAMFLKIGCLSILAVCCIEMGADFLGEIKKIPDIIGANEVYVKLVLRCIGIGYMCDLIGKFAREEGLLSIATQLELIGKLSMLTMALPILMTLLESLKLLVSG